VLMPNTPPETALYPPWRGHGRRAQGAFWLVGGRYDLARANFLMKDTVSPNRRDVLVGLEKDQKLQALAGVPNLCATCGSWIESTPTARTQAYRCRVPNATFIGAYEADTLAQTKG
jgi:hypothetical protein